MKTKYLILLFVIISLNFVYAESVADCGENWDCFIDASVNCNLSKVLNTSTIDVSGIGITTTNYYEIKGLAQNKCVFYLRTEEQHIGFSEELIQEMLDSNFTQEEINQQLNESNSLADSLEGLDGNCNFDTGNLTAMLVRWKKGNFSDHDWDNAGCSGDYFGTQTDIMELTPTTTITFYPTKFNVVVNSSENISQYKWDFGNDTKITSVNNVVYTYNKTGQYLLEVTAKTSSGRTFLQVFNVTVELPTQVINTLITEKSNSLLELKEQIKTFDPFYQSSLSSTLNIELIEEVLDAIQLEFSNASSDQDYYQIMDALLSLEVPSSVTTTKTANSISFYFKEDNINLEVLKSIEPGNYSISDESKYPNSIFAWNFENIETKLTFKELSAKYDTFMEPILNVFELKINKKNSLDYAPYLIIRELEGLNFKEDYSVKEESGYFYIDLTDIDTVSFSTTEDITFDELPVFISPGISKLSIESFDIKENGEGKQNWVLFILIIVLLAIIGFVVYIILQEWYKKEYENYLFKNQNNLYNLLTYIDGARKKGMMDKEIISKLKKAGWGSEQINYVLKKHAGERTGMFEIPISKILNMFKKNNVQEVQQGNLPAE